MLHITFDTSDPSQPHYLAWLDDESKAVSIDTYPRTEDDWARLERAVRKETSVA